jgi:hypothetical protein
MIPIYRDPKQSIEARTDDLLSRMTLEEKVAQLGSAWVYELLTGGVWDKDKVGQTLNLGIGQISRVGGASSLRPLDSARLANRIQRYLQDETRLGIPALIHEECCSGYNIGERAGDEVVQLYVKDMVASVTRPVKALQGFRRVRLGAGERKTVEFSLAIEDLAFYDRDMNWVVEPGEFAIMAGTSSADLPLEGRIKVVE